ncbi:MAG: hypothetical protein AABZ55_07895 [Bdellovibrionota bacterium]
MTRKSKLKGDEAQKKFGKRPFPKVALEEALRVPQKIKELNAGNPWSAEDLAKAFEISRSNPKFYYLTAGSRDYGLTTGNSSSSKIGLTDLGKELVFAPNATAEEQAKRKAFLSVDVFKKVLEYYKGNALPEMKYLGNTLQKEFGLAPDAHEEFSRLFTLNCEYLKITSGTYNGNRIDADS